MPGIVLPELGGLADLLPIADRAAHTNIGAGVGFLDYQAPAGRVAVITHWLGSYIAGTAPTFLLMEIFDSSSARKSDVIRAATPALHANFHLQSPVMLAPGDQLRIATAGGGADTGLLHSWAGFEMLWDPA